MQMLFVTCDDAGLLASRCISLDERDIYTKSLFASYVRLHPSILLGYSSQACPLLTELILFDDIVLFSETSLWLDLGPPGPFVAPWSPQSGSGAAITREKLRFLQMA